MADADEISSLSFEKALAALEEIVARLEGGKVELAESIKIYERGEALRKHCEAKLAEAEARIEKITLDPSGKPKGTAPLDVD
jgi:exodeoxyribonuclease VII small subunit